MNVATYYGVDIWGARSDDGEVDDGLVDTVWADDPIWYDFRVRKMHRLQEKDAVRLTRIGRVDAKGVWS